MVPPPVETVKASKSKWLFVLYENEKAKHAFQSIDDARKWFGAETEIKVEKPGEFDDDSEEVPQESADSVGVDALGKHGLGDVTARRALLGRIIRRKTTI